MPSGTEYRVGDFYCNGTSLIAYLGNEKNVIIPEGITCIGRDDVLMCSAFGGTSVVSVTFPSTLKVVEHHTFDGCKDLKTVKMNSGLEKIGSFCFHETGLESITIPETVTLVESFAFEDSMLLKNVEIKSKKIRFDNDVFAGTPFLKSLYNKDKIAIYGNYLLDAVGYKKSKFVVPSQVTSIAGGVFFTNRSVEEIVMHNKVTTLGSEVFRNCESLKKIKMSNKITTIPYWAFVRTDLEEITIPASVTSIESGAFYGTSIKKVNFKTKTTNFEEDVFADTFWLDDMQALSPYVIVNGVLLDATTVSGKAVVPDTVKIINDDAFAGNEKVTEIIIPDSVERIDDHAFWCCYKLKNIDLGNSVKEIGFGAFEDCRALTEVIFPDSVEKLGKNLLSDSKNVKYVRLPANLSRLEDYALADTSITSIVLPSALSYVGTYALDSCKKLSKIYLSSNKIENGIYLSGGAGTDDLTVYYPQDTKSDWLREYLGGVGIGISQPNYSLNFKTMTLYSTWYGKQLQLEDEFQRYVSNSEILWKSDNTSVATVSNGMVRPISVGTATISATYNDKTYTCIVTVKAPSLNKTKSTLLFAGDNDFLCLFGAKSSDVKWTSSKKSVVSVSQKGTITGKKKGTATVTATVGGKKYSCKVTVK